MKTTRIVNTPAGQATAVGAANARQSFVPLNSQAPGVAARVATINVPAVRAKNARQNR